MTPKREKTKTSKSKAVQINYEPFVLKVDEDSEEHFYEVVDKICSLNQQCDHRKAFANLLISNSLLRRGSLLGNF